MSQPAEHPDTSPGAALPGLRFAVGGVAIALGIAALHYGAALLQPLVFAALLAFVLAPLVSRLRRWRLPNTLAVGLVVSSTVALLGLSSMLVGQQLVQLSRDLPSYQETVRDKLRALRPSRQDHSPIGDVLRLLGVVEGELDAARRALSSPSPKPVQRVQVEPAPPQPLQALATLTASALMPLAQLGLTLVLLVGMLLQRHEMRDRLLRLLGNELHPMADALNEAGRRVSRYLLAQVLVNLSFGLPLGLGLWLLGIPGAWLWGLLGALLRFVPYLGPVLAAAFPLLLAFAVDPGWTLVLQTALLIGLLELLLNNIVEPLAYGNSTGVSPLAVLLSAGFWSLVWGPVGLALATPITVCLLVLGRHLGPLRLLEQLLSNQPVFDPAMRLHQRLICGDVEEALELSHQAAARDGVVAAYQRMALPALGLAANTGLSGLSGMTSAHRHRLVSGMAAVLQQLRDDGGETAPGAPRVLCIGARNELDTLSAEMLAHALRLEGLAARAEPASALAADQIDRLELQGVAAVCVCSFSPSPATHARYVARRLRRSRPELPLLLAAWQAGEAEAPGEDWTLVANLPEALLRLKAWAAQWPSALPPAPAAESASDPQQQQLARCAQRIVDVFGAASATALLQLPGEAPRCASAGLPSLGLRDAAALLAEGSPLGLVLQQGEALVVSHLDRDARFSDYRPLQADGLRFFAGVPLAAPGKAPCGVLALHEPQTRSFGRDELRLLERMAAELAEALLEQVADGAPAAVDAPGLLPAHAG